MWCAVSSHQSELALREAHTLSGKPSVVFIDEIDALCPRRDSRREQDACSYSCSTAFTDAVKGFVDRCTAFVVASTNPRNMMIYFLSGF
ncbi:putative ATPase, AAA-type, core, P-loop containing nucleoside triphosphate hydrolase [Rosa chinensis]|uniref:Putative ATPase, AAA-type, core, P-loop containing nucleoside triphosphate hydrolase n=1 Tax=Rosa chinensis TaxID=74649 RepID=A0A2P6P302_ROSCH|nr:putative ATPase, AAA-type, core, P-loop containing nucleoside triphosphate hydrolase [Rosa chinensis]